MKRLLLLFVIAIALTTLFALPVTKTEPKKEEKAEENPNNDVEVKKKNCYFCWEIHCECSLLIDHLDCDIVEVHW